MKPTLSFTILFLIAGATLYYSCKKEYSCENCKGANKPPIANAGKDTSIILPTDSVLLDGSASDDPDDGIASYQWTKISGPDTFQISNPSSSKTTVRQLVKAVYQFELTVTDKAGLSDKDTMQVIANPAGIINRPPVANAGNDSTIILPVNAATLDGSRSSDPDNNITGYTWTKISGPSAFSITTPNTVQTQLINLAEGVYRFELKVTDAGGLFSMDTVQMIVNHPAQANRPPVANTGADQTIFLPANSVTLDGSASTDTDGKITNWLWTKLSGPASAAIISPSDSVTDVINLVAGIYQFELKVTDNGGLFSKDTLQLIVNDDVHSICDINNRPLINAQLVPFGTLSIARMGMAVASAGNKILFAGGRIKFFNQPGDATSRVDIYDIATHDWSTAELSAARWEIGVAVSGNKIFFAGGVSSNGVVGKTFANVDIYDASTNTWTVDALSTPKWGPAGGAVGNKVFFAGGIVGYNTPTSVVDIYDFSTKAWSAAALNVPRGFISAITANNRIYFAGGHNYQTPLNTVDIYDNATSSWSVSALNEPRGHLAGVAVAGKLYWAGGVTANSAQSNQVEIKDVPVGGSTQACLFQPNSSFSAVEKNHKIVFFTGGGDVKNRFDVYDIATSTWSIGVLPREIVKASIISVKNELYVAGSFVNGVLSNQVWKLEF